MTAMAQNKVSVETTDAGGVRLTICHVGSVEMDAWEVEQLELLLRQARERSKASSPGRFSAFTVTTKCVHCGHEYETYKQAVYICGAVPTCPKCGRIQGMSWESKR